MLSHSFPFNQNVKTLRGTKKSKVYETGVSFSQPHAFDVPNDGRGKLAVGSK